jgi:MFS family permease
MVILVTFGQTAENLQVWGVLIKPMTKEFGWSRTAFSGATGIGTLVAAFVGLAVGPILDRFGPRWIVVVTVFIMGASLLLMARISTLWQFYLLLALGRVMHIGILGVATSVIIPKWFIVQRGRAVAIGGLGNRIGNAVTPLYTQALVSAANWRVAVAVVGIVTWAISLVPSALFLRRLPEDMGLRPDGAPAEAPASSQTAPADRQTRNRSPEVSLSPRQVLRLPSFYLLTAAFSLSFAITTSISLHLQPALTDRGLTEGTAVAVVALSAATGALGTLLFGFLAERITARWALLLSLALFAIGFVFLVFVRSGTGALVWGAFFGLVQAPSFTLFQVIYADYYGRDSLGAIRGLVSPPQSFIQAVGPVAAALAYDTMGSYTLVFYLFSILSFGMVLCVFWARPPVVPSQP